MQSVADDDLKSVERTLSSPHEANLLNPTKQELDLELRGCLDHFQEDGSEEGFPVAPVWMCKQQSRQLRPIYNAPSLAMAALLIRHGAEIYPDDVELGNLAIEHRPEDEALALLKFFAGHGVDFSRRAEGSGLSPMHVAMRHHSADIARFLLEQGVSATVRDSQGRTPLPYLAQSENQAPVLAAKLRLLLEAGAPLESRDQAGNTPLHLAVISPNPHAMEIFLRAGASLSATNLEGHSPLYVFVEEMCSWAGESEMLRLRSKNLQFILSFPGSNSAREIEKPADLVRQRMKQDPENGDDYAMILGILQKAASKSPY